MKHIVSLFIALFITFLSIQAQPVLTLDDVMQQALKNNYGIITARNDVDMANNNRGWGNAGALPQVALGSAYNFGHNDLSDQKYANPATPEQIKSGAESRNLSGGLALNWTLFDGLKMFATYDKLEALNEQSKMALKIKIETTLVQVISGYYDIVKQKQMLKALQESVDIYQDRLKIAESKLELGSAAKLEVLQAKVDLNAQRSSILKQRQILQDSKTNLNYLLARNADEVFDVNDSIPVIPIVAFQQVREKVYQQNSGLQFAVTNQTIAKYSLREAQSLRLPMMGLTGGYNISRATNGAGFISYNYSRGYNIGFSVNWYLFNGFYVNRTIKNARLTISSTDQQYLSVKADLDGVLAKGYQNFLNNSAILQMEQENFSLAKENMDVALLRYKLGSISSLELKDAQKSYLDAQNRLVSARYDAKASEVNLQRLSGELLK